VRFEFTTRSVARRELSVSAATTPAVVVLNRLANTEPRARWRRRPLNKSPVGPTTFVSFII